MDVIAQSGLETPGETLNRYYVTLLREFGPQGWWPARTRLEVILGAILTQNTTWRNATLALKDLKKAGLLSWAALRRTSAADLESCIRSAGFYRQKARTIRGFVGWLECRHKGSLDAFFSLGPHECRRHLLSLNGIGPETADAILLYAGRHAVFVSDAYTRRVLARHQLLPATADYESAREFLHQHLPPNESMFNEFHALLVEVAKRYCRRQVAHCESCPLRRFLSEGKPALGLSVPSSAFPKVGFAASQEGT